MKKVQIRHANKIITVISIEDNGNQPMNLKDIYQKLTIDVIDDYVSAGQEEHLQLEFKEINSPDFKNKDDKINLAKALTGFANSSGGIIVWGIQAKKNSEGVDCALKKNPIKKLSLFISKLNELTGRATSPLVDHIEHKKISIAGGDEGFAATLVLESDSGPHMAKLGEDRYYKRSGDSFYKMEHFDIEDMFGRRKKPDLQLIVSPIQAHKFDHDQVIDVEFLVSIENKGRGVAKAPFLAGELPINCHWSTMGVDGNRNYGLPQLYKH